jgi:hypothetical protein
MGAIRTLGGFTSIASVISRRLANRHTHLPFGHFLRLTIPLPNFRESLFRLPEPSLRCLPAVVSPYAPEVNYIRLSRSLADAALALAAYYIQPYRTLASVASMLSVVAVASMLSAVVAMLSAVACMPFVDSLDANTLERMQVQLETRIQLLLRICISFLLGVLRLCLPFSNYTVCHVCFLTQHKSCRK